MQEKTLRVIATGKILRKLNVFQQAWLENEVRQKVLEAARKQRDMPDIAYSALNSSTDIVYDFVQVAYELDGIPFSKETFINYVITHHKETEADATWIAQLVGLPSKDAPNFDEAVAAPRSFPLPFLLSDVEMASQNLPGAKKYSEKTLRRVANGLTAITWLSEDARNANSAVGLPKCTMVRVTPTLRTEFENAVREAQLQQPPPTDVPPSGGKWATLCSTVALFLAIAVAQPAYSDQSTHYVIAATYSAKPAHNFKVPVEEDLWGDVLKLQGYEATQSWIAPQALPAVYSPGVDLDGQAWKVGVQQVNTLHKDLWGDVLKLQGYEATQSWIAPQALPAVYSPGVDLDGQAWKVGVQQVNTLHKDLWGDVLNK